MNEHPEYMALDGLLDIYTALAQTLLPNAIEPQKYPPQLPPLGVQFLLESTKIL